MPLRIRAASQDTDQNNSVLRVARDPKNVRGEMSYEERTDSLPRSTRDARHLVAGNSLDVFLDDFPTVSREQAVTYLQMTLEFANARVA